MEHTKELEKVCKVLRELPDGVDVTLRAEFPTCKGDTLEESGHWRMSVDGRDIHVSKLVNGQIFPAAYWHRSYVTDEWEVPSTFQFKLPPGLTKELEGAVARLTNMIIAKWKSWKKGITALTKSKN
jgi:hypothetical protein